MATTGDLLAYIRRAADEAFLIALNLGEAPYELSLESLGLQGRRILSSYLDGQSEGTTQEFALRSNEGIIVALGAAAT